MAQPLDPSLAGDLAQVASRAVLLLGGVAVFLLLFGVISFGRHSRQRSQNTRQPLARLDGTEMSGESGGPLNTSKRRLHLNGVLIALIGITTTLVGAALLAVLLFV